MEKVIPWLTLQSVPGIGNLLFKKLIARFGSPQATLTATRQELIQIPGISPRLATALKNHKTPDWVLRDLDTAARRQYHIITQHDIEYPALLHHIADPPPVLYIHGRLNPSACYIAVVGSRNATDYGRVTTQRLCAALAARQVTVVSGMARGIDTAAHKGALFGSGSTVAVLGTGLNRIYPPENQKLYHQIAENGCVISEFTLDTEPKPHHFPQRNRIISGMSWGTVVVEAAQRSGSLITARLATEQGREVFAVPGNVHSFMSRGTHDLIKQGAKLVENAEDIVQELAAQIELPQPNCAKASKADTYTLKNLNDTESRIFGALGPYPLHIDELTRQLNLDAAAAAAILLQLELKGLICQQPGKYFTRNADFISEDI